MPRREPERRKQRERFRARRLGVTQHRHAFDAIAESEDRLNWIVEGDSWFAYPSRWLLFGPNSNLADQLFKRWVGTGKVNALCLAANGDTAQEMFSGSQLERMRSVLRRHGPAISAVLLSAGGNDLLGEAPFASIIRPAGAPRSIEDYLDLEALRGLFDRIEAAFDTLCMTVAEHAPAATVYAHSYDLAMPANRPATFFGGIRFTGPWMYPALHRQGVPEDQWLNIVAYLIEAYLALLGRVRARSAVAVEIVDLRGQLRPGNEDDWADEIHPSSEGFARLADALAGRLTTDFPALARRD
ncbi:MAG: SGNH/GDSL hydrolase family protein [Pseudomonadota bacterium]